MRKMSAKDSGNNQFRIYNHEKGASLVFWRVSVDLEFGGRRGRHPKHLSDSVPISKNFVSY